MARTHLVYEVLKALQAKADCKISTFRIEVPRPYVYNKETAQMEPNPARKNDLGNKSWGKIDYLVNHLNYTLVYV